MQIIRYFVAYVLVKSRNSTRDNHYLLSIRNMRLRIVLNDFIFDRFLSMVQITRTLFVNQEDPEDDRSIDRSTITSDSRNICSYRNGAFVH